MIARNPDVEPAAPGDILRDILPSLGLRLGEVAQRLGICPRSCPAQQAAGHADSAAPRQAPRRPRWERLDEPAGVT